MYKEQGSNARPLKTTAENLIHDYVFEFVENKVKALNKSKYIIHDIPIISAAKKRDIKFDYIFLIESSRNVRYDRLVNSRFIPIDYANIMIDNSLDISEYEKDYTLKFDSSKISINTIINDIIEQL